jgi:hypothetical protein
LLSVRPSLCVSTLIFAMRLMTSPCYLCVFVSLALFSFHMRSMSYQRKVGNQFFPELPVLYVTTLELGTPFRNTHNFHVRPLHLDVLNALSRSELLSVVSMGILVATISIVT